MRMGRDERSSTEFRPGRPWDELKAIMEEAGRNDPAKWRDARSFGMVYPGGPEVDRVIREAYAMFFVENGRHVAAFPSIRRFEADIVAMTAHLFRASEPVGKVLSGGTECALVAMKTVRDQAAAERGIEVPEVILPANAYPVYAMAAHYLGVTVVPVPIDATYKADLGALKDAITARTIMIVGSAPGWSHGVIDPIAEMGQIARAHDIHLHVDACVGGYQIPFIRRLGYPATNFDFTLPGVSSVAADLHKFGYSAQGSAVLVYRDAAARPYQGFRHPGWPMGSWSNDALLTSRPAGAVAASWAVMNFLGEDGYLRLTDSLMKTTRKFLDGIGAIPGLRIMGEPQTSVFAFTADSPDVDINRVADTLDEKGWFIRRRENASIHLVLTPPHAEVADAFLADLRQVVLAASAHHA
jgi:glutamate/tyrosine decarboxylase-like PLP-dependent enzyme